jgi:hypothetical protein
MSMPRFSDARSARRMCRDDARLDIQAASPFVSKNNTWSSPGCHPLPGKGPLPASHVPERRPSTPHGRFFCKKPAGIGCGPKRTMGYADMRTMAAL